MSKRAIIYTRVSSTEQVADATSLAHQEKVLRDFCAYKGWGLVNHLQDAGVSAKTDKRDGLQTALGMLYCGDADLLVVTHLDRFARNARDCLNMIEEGKAQGWKVVFADMDGMSFDSDSSMGKLMITVLAAVAENFSNLTSEKVKRRSTM